MYKEKKIKQNYKEYSKFETYSVIYIYLNLLYGLLCRQQYSPAFYTLNPKHTCWMLSWLLPSVISSCCQVDAIPFSVADGTVFQPAEECWESKLLLSKFRWGEMFQPKLFPNLKLLTSYENIKCITSDILFQIFLASSIQNPYLCHILRLYHILRLKFHWQACFDYYLYFLHFLLVLENSV